MTFSDRAPQSHAALHAGRFGRRAGPRAAGTVPIQTARSRTICRSRRRDQINARRAALRRGIGHGSGPGPNARAIALPDRSFSADAEGQWVQAEGIVRAVEDDGTLLLMEKDGAVKVWLKGAPTNSLERYVDALVQVRGVYSKRIPVASDDAGAVAGLRAGEGICRRKIHSSFPRSRSARWACRTSIRKRCIA